MRHARDDAEATAVLAVARAEGCEFGPTLANHLPMVLVALRELGASTARLDAYAASYRAQNGLAPPPPPVAKIEGTITTGHWTAHLGERAREADYRAFFHAEVRRLGAAEAQRRALPVLLPGIAASALHALMRLAYAHLDDTYPENGPPENGHPDQVPGEVATALGYWAATYLPLPHGDGPGDTADVAAVLARLRAMPHLLRIEPETDLLWHAIRAVGHDPAFAAELDRLAADADHLPAFAAAALALHAGAADFCSLHALTSMHWLRVLPPGVVDRGAALRQLWRALAAAYPKMGLPVPPSAALLDEWRRAPCPSWDAIAAAAIASDDEHDISLVFSARAEARAWGDPLYRVVAARRMGLA